MEHTVDVNLEKIKINFKSLCYIKEKLSLGNSYLYSCDDIDDKKECIFNLKSNSEIKYDFKYDNYYIDSITIKKELKYSVNVNSINGKARFEIFINEPYSSIDVKYIKIIDSSNPEKFLSVNDIYFDINKCIIEIAVYDLA